MNAELDITTESGCACGVLATGWPVRIWRGLPYAAPPVGPLRWRAPALAPRWQGVRQASAFGSDSVQAPMPASRAAAMGEDCLYANIWSPVGAQPGSLPVMVWLHGGGFVGGSGADARSEGTRLAAMGVVVVSFNYRAGVFGYLAHPSLSAEGEAGTSGNYGLLDQMAALRWVQRNIAAFGGDPARVTAFGVSAGSASIALMLVVPSACGLFQQAILHSPGTARPLASLAYAERAGAALGRIDDLRALSAIDVLALTPRLSPRVRGLTTPRVLRPIRDGWLLPEDERPVFLAGRLHQMPIIVGTNADEGTLLTRSWPADTLDQHRALIEANFPSAMAEAQKLYSAATGAEVRPAIAAAFGDTQFNYGSRLLARAMADLGRPTWRYLFTRRRPGQTDGPHHGDEVAYVFGNLDAGRESPRLPSDHIDQTVSTTMMGAWVSFAQRGDPNGPGLAEWPRYTTLLDRHQQFGDRVVPGADPRCEHLDFLHRFFEARLAEAS